MSSTYTQSEHLSFVIPVYRSEQTICGVLDEIVAEFPGSEIIIVSDGSPDLVADKVRSYSKRKKLKIRMIELKANRGQHYAILLGFGLSTRDFVVTIDDDGQNPVREIHNLLKRFTENHRLDCVYGAITVKMQNLHRRFVSNINQRLAEIFLRKPHHIQLSNVRVLRGELARKICQFPSPFPYVDSLILFSTQQIDSIVIDHKERKHGQSGYTLTKLFRLALSHYTTFSNLPLMVFSIFSMCLSLSLFFFTTIWVVRSLLGGQAPPGWMSLMALQGAMFSLLFCFLSVLGIYVGRLYISQNSRFPPYFCDEHSQ